MSQGMEIDEVMEEEKKSMEVDKKEEDKNDTEQQRRIRRDAMRKAEKEKLEKEEKENMEELLEKLETLEKQAKSGDLAKAMEKLFSLEKVHRLASQWELSSTVAVRLLKICFEMKEFEMIKEKTSVLSKKRQQHRIVITNMVHECINYLDSMPDKESEIALIQTLREITSGKIFVEVERARLTRRLSQIHEKEGEFVKAAEILLEVQVETHGSMDNYEKTEFILEQIRLNLARKDYPRVFIIAEKINPKVFNEKPKDETKSFADLERVYHGHMIQYFLHVDNLFDVAKAYHRMLLVEYKRFRSGESVPATRWEDDLRKCIVYSLCSPRSPEQQSLIYSLYTDQRPLREDRFHLYRSLLDSFLTKELILWKNVEIVFRNEFFTVLGLNQELWLSLRKRTIEHSIFVLSESARQMRLSRICSLLGGVEGEGEGEQGVSSAEVEKLLCAAVVSGEIHARIDRPAGIVSFMSPESAQEVMEKWTSGMDSSIDIIEDATYEVRKEVLGNPTLRRVQR